MTRNTLSAVHYLKWSFAPWHRINISRDVSSQPGSSQFHNWLLIVLRPRPSSPIQTRALLRMWAGAGPCDYNININWNFPRAHDILTIKAAVFGFCYRRIQSKIESDNERSLAPRAGIGCPEGEGDEWDIRDKALLSGASLINPEMAAILAIGDNVVVNMSPYLDISMQNFQPM